MHLHFNAWLMLANACESKNDLKRAEYALQQIVQIQMRSFVKQIQLGKTGGGSLNYLREYLETLFSFYERKNLVNEGRAAYKTYSENPNLRVLWNSSDRRNSKLMGLTRTYVPVIDERPPVPGVWPPLHAELARVNEISDLKALRDRLFAAIDTGLPGSKAVKSGAALTKDLLDTACAVTDVQATPQQFRRNLETVNQGIHSAEDAFRKEPELSVLRPIVTATQRAFESLSHRLRAYPVLQIDPVPLGPGLSDDAATTALVIRVENPGPGEVTDLRASCPGPGPVSSRSEGLLPQVGEHGHGIIGIPVTVSAPPDRITVECPVMLRYRWGILKDLRAEQKVRVNWMSYQEWLHRHGVDAWELPSPYVYRDPIDFKRNDPRLFQGREEELDSIRESFVRGQPTGLIPYFHGVRKVGKTSLLNRLAVELESASFAAVLVDLKGIRADAQTTSQVVNSFTAKVLGFGGSSIDVSGMSAVPVDHPNPLTEIEPFFQRLRERTGTRKLVLLLDEFQGVVAQHTTALLDLLSLVHQHGFAWFILSGFMRPDRLKEACPYTQLWPLKERPLDFLSEAAVGRVLKEPVADYGVEFPDATVARAFQQTAGYPYHVGWLADAAIALLNAERRTVVSPQDIDRICESIASEDAAFTSTWLSPLFLSADEQRTAVEFAKALGPQESMDTNQAINHFGFDKIKALDTQLVLQVKGIKGDQIGIRSKLLRSFLSKKLSTSVTLLPPEDKPRVGLFVDIENLWPQVPAGMEVEEVGRILYAYAGIFGSVVCAWGCADPRNLDRNLRLKGSVATRQALERAGFRVEFPRPELLTAKTPKADLADFALIERITDESDHIEPDVYLIVSGDKGYFAKITRLLDEKGAKVRMVCALDGTLATEYRELAQQRKQQRIARGYAESDMDFYVDDLRHILGGRTETTSA